MDYWLEKSEHELQEAALVFMALVYTTRIIWLFCFKAGGERQAPTGSPTTTSAKGILYSWANIAMPWAMESTRKRFFLYVQFVVFHLGVTAAIALSFIIPYYYKDQPVNEALVWFFQVVIGAAFVVGVMRIIRRVGSPYLRAISSPDDYFSLVLLTVWFLSAVLAAPNDSQTTAGQGKLLAFFILTAFFLVYVPFSKISHYLYYPFTRYYFGKTMGYRGVYPVRRR
jgi:nitrate reductase gamma subunit